jgi:predicted RNA-binding protein associated with RNAse of E/G family
MAEQADWHRGFIQNRRARSVSEGALSPTTFDLQRTAVASLYFGTTTGQLWIGRDVGERWQCFLFRLEN